MSKKRVEVNPGDRFGRWTVIREEEPIAQRRRILCMCECGVERVVLLSGLKTGQSRSCGCLQRETSAATGKANTTHGMTHCPTFNAWSGMKQRCLNPANKKFPNYGARGISVCERWLASFEDFLSDMGERPSHKHSIERLNVNGNYTPDNCCWATQVVQQRNRRNNSLLTFRGETMCISAWAERLGVPYKTIYSRLNYGWTDEQALATPVRGRRAP